MEQVVSWKIEYAVQSTKETALTVLAVYVLLILEFEVLQLAENLLVNLNPIEKEREDWVPFVRAQHGRDVYLIDLRPVLDRLCDIVQLLEVHLGETSKEYAWYLVLGWLIFLPHLILWEQKVAMLVRDQLRSFVNLCAFPVFTGRCRHNKPCIDARIRVLELVYTLDWVDFLELVQVIDHAMWSHSDLKNVVVKLHALLYSTLDCGEVALRHLSHLDMLNITMMARQEMNAQHFTLDRANHIIVDA